jgi:hypothetical protein
VIVRGQIGIRKKVKSADTVFYPKPNMPLAEVRATPGIIAGHSTVFNNTIFLLDYKAKAIA